MPLFDNPKTEDAVCTTLRALSEEYGKQFITVHLPKSWDTPDNRKIWVDTKVAFDMGKSIKFEVNYPGFYDPNIPYSDRPIYFVHETPIDHI